MKNQKQKEANKKIREQKKQMKIRNKKIYGKLEIKRSK